MELLKELVESEQENDVDVLPLLEALEESVKSLGLQQKGGKVNAALKGARSFFNANPGLVAGAAVMAVSSIQQYRKNQRNTIKLHAKSPYEKKMMTTITDALVKSGSFTVKRIKFEGGGKTWVLKRKWS